MIITQTEADVVAQVMNMYAQAHAEGRLAELGPWPKGLEISAVSGRVSYHGYYPYNSPGSDPVGLTELKDRKMLELYKEIQLLEDIVP